MDFFITPKLGMRNCFHSVTSSKKQPHLVAVLLGGLDEGLHVLGPFRLMRVASMEFAAYLIISALGMSVKITRKLLSIIGR